MYAVKLGNHRSVAIIILTKMKKIMSHLVVGNVGGKALTAGELVRLFDSKQLATLNTNFRGVPWVDESKIEGIVNNFNPALLFDGDRDGGVGVELQVGGRISYHSIKVDFGHGDLLVDYLKNKWKVS